MVLNISQTEAQSAALAVLVNPVFVGEFERIRSQCQHAAIFGPNFVEREEARISLIGITELKDAITRVSEGKVNG